MKNLMFRIGGTLTAGALIASSVAGAAFATDTVAITENGANSVNTVNINNTCVSTVSQSNNLIVGVEAVVSASTGGNIASSNTGGDVTIGTGNAASSVGVVVGGSTNTAQVPSCCICVTGLDVTIDTNGAKSENTTTVTNTVVQGGMQTNAAIVGVKAKVKAKTGKNKAKKNTGGTTGITTGAATSSLGVTVSAPSNTN